MPQNANGSRIRVAPSTAKPGCYEWTIQAAGGQRRASAPYASATPEAARLSADCWRQVLDDGPARPALSRVLIAEDNAIYAEALRCVLARAGHAIVGVAECADEASVIAQAERPDLALIDLTLRDGFSGLELGRRLARAGVGVLFLTATPDLVPAGIPGVLGVLAKPAEDARLLKAVTAARAGIDAVPAVPASIETYGAARPGPTRIVVTGLAIAMGLALMALTAWSIERAPVQAYGAIARQAQGT